MLKIENQIEVEAKINWLKTMGKVNVNVELVDDQGAIVLVSPSPIKTKIKGIYTYKMLVPAHLLNAKVYWLNLVVVERGRMLKRVDEVISFEVVDSSKRQGWYGKWPGAVRPNLDWQIRQAK